MFLRAKVRKKDGKLHRYWSIVESQRVRGGRVVQRHVLYLGEINDSQCKAWCRSIEVLEDGADAPSSMALFPEGRAAPELSCEVVKVRLSALTVNRARQWGACWLALAVWGWVDFDQFWRPRLGCNREGTDWLNVFKTLVCYRLLDPGSEWRLHRQWFERSAMGDLLGEDAGLAQASRLYRCLDLLVEHKQPMFSFLRERWQTLFNAGFEVLLYDLTSTYFESDPPEHESIRKFGYSRDKRPDCVQVVIALIVTPEGLAAGLRGHGWQHLGQDDAVDICREDRSAIWQGEAYLGDGSRGPHGSDARADAHGESEDRLPGRHGAREVDQAGEAIPGASVAAGARASEGQAA